MLIPAGQLEEEDESGSPSEKVQLRLPREIVEEMRDLAERRGVGVSTIARMLIMSALEQPR